MSAYGSLDQQTANEELKEAPWALGSLWAERDVSVRGV